MSRRREPSHQRLASTLLLGVPLASLPLIGLMVLGCGGCGSEAQAQEPIQVSPECPRAEGAAWESAPWPGESGSASCGWQSFEGRQTYVVTHNRGTVPIVVLPYLSFHPDGRSSAPSAGDMTRIIAVDETSITLRNNTNENFFLKLVLQ